MPGDCDLSEAGQAGIPGAERVAERSLALRALEADGGQPTFHDW